MSGMNELPQTDDTLLIRTDFSDEEAWQALATAVATPNEDDFRAYVHVVDDPAYRDLAPEQIAALAPDSLLLFVVDKAALTSPGRPVLALYLTEDGREHVRVVVEELWSIENNLSLANMDWEEFTEAADEDGVFRGF
jgi:hypothetical protein